MRTVTAFPCAGETLLGTLDGSHGTTGLLIVSGGNEIRIGAHRGMALLAQQLALQGIPVFRFDRRGIGDSTGENCGFRSSGPDITAAATWFRKLARIDRLIAFGNCDAATALALYGADAGVDRLILANPWVIEQTDPLPPAAAIRARYRTKLRDPREWLRLARGGVDLVKLFRGLGKLVQRRSHLPDSLRVQCIEAISRNAAATTILLARHDATAIAFQDVWDTSDRATRDLVPMHVCDTASHSFAGGADAAWLERQILAAILRD